MSSKPSHAEPSGVSDAGLARPGVFDMIGRQVESGGEQGGVDFGPIRSTI